VKLPVSSWTAAEAANLLFVWVTNLILGTFGLKQNQASAASRRLLPENEGKGRVVQPAQVGSALQGDVPVRGAIYCDEGQSQSQILSPVGENLTA
jgi:hypothetical protein